MTNAKPLIRDVFRVTGLDRVIDIVNSFNIDKPEIEPVKARPAESIRMGDLLVGELNPDGETYRFDGMVVVLPEAAAGLLG